MKHMAAVFWILALFLSPAQAGSATGSEAQRIAHALWNAMGITSCASGSCVFHAENVKCAQATSGKYGCVLDAQRLRESKDADVGYEGRTESLMIRGWRARNLMEMLIANGVEIESREQGSIVSVSSLACWKEFKTPILYSCDWQVKSPIEE